MKESTTLNQANLTEQELFRRLENDKRKLRFVIPSYVAKLKYQLWLVLLRETSILITLINNYDKIPAQTPTKLIVRLFVNLSFMRKMIFAVEKRLRKRIY